MKMSNLFGRTLRDIPAEADLTSHKLLLQSGMIHQVATGVYSYLPLAWRSIKKIEKIVREEMDNAGAQELKLGILQPRELWQKSGRDEVYGPDMIRLKDRRERELVLPPTNEELITETVKSMVQSHRDLPFMLYQIQTKFRDEPRPRGGLIRVREFDMMDAYSFDLSESGLDVSYDRMVEAYKKTFKRCGIETVVVDADSGAIGGKDSKEFILITESGEDTIVLCDSCDYAANDEKAEFQRLSNQMESPGAMERVDTPGIKTIDQLSDYMGVGNHKTIKAVFYLADSEIIFVAIRGDLEVNEVKLKNCLGVSELRLATPEEVSEAGLVAGSASPVGVEGFRVISDHSLRLGYNLIAGANTEGYHLKNVNFPRDFKSDIESDIALAEEGHQCSRCDGCLKTFRGIEIGHVFKLGISYSESLDASYSDSDGINKRIVMGCYGIGIGRILSGAVEQLSDQKGIVFPKNIAPYDVLIVGLNTDKHDVSKSASDLYENLSNNGLEVLYDDRHESAGVKFNDADLLGIPVRVVVSNRNLQQGSVEVKSRTSEKGIMVSIDSACTEINSLLESIG